MNSLTNVSIIIPSFNEESNIFNLLNSIFSQNNKDDKISSEVIIIDNGSTDETVALSQQFDVKIYIRPDDSIADLRNYGASHAAGEILIFSDADNIFTPNLTSTVVEIFATEYCHALGPDGLKPVEPATWMQHIWYLHTRRFNQKNRSMKVKNLSSGFFAIRRDDFVEVNGFNGDLSVGEDSDLSFRLNALGKILLRTNRILVLNSGHPKNILEFLKREFWHGDSIRHLIYHKNIDRLTIYLFFHIIVLLMLVYSMIFKVNLFLSLSLMLCIIVPPTYKSFKKLGGFKKKFLSLSGIYFLYLCARSAALFKSVFLK